MNYTTEQEKFWASQEWAQAYIQRNDHKFVRNNIALFSKILNSTRGIGSMIEFGSNIGLNLIALKQLVPDMTIDAIEINPIACEELQKLNFLNKIYNDSILEIDLKSTYDLVLIKGVLIHINPDFLDTVYEKLYNASNKYIVVAEYYNPTPVSIDYRGHKDKLFKRDFAGEMMEKFSDLKLLDYGFVYHKDNNFPQDDTTWFLLEKVN
ncbi:pseudaminic acid biosynthesis-associated methylase [Arcobacter sp. FWKO B]|uniref:pseudaminic acid biosynthesis-associated methylase n=1 Tax=Arcobacter sp. FWKO B TaxID=2593672 RepID=UPI0018A5C21F|nr:pseudaminic acid biosynthesis-associated methylase [Arcobacter sp. FWKO B]QOG12153.1 pseudaminic acid biosynthesis-associated methylase [Arcobacter sp. FWKO B]